MSNLFSQLFKYRSSDKARPQENFSTEILCAILNGLSSDQATMFFNLVHYSGSDHDIIWKTQYPIDFEGRKKYPDLVAVIGNKPVIIIEVKIDASFTDHKSKNGKNKHQLEVYREWLDEKNSDGILVLLTKNTTPPEGFLQQDKNIVVTWQDVFRFLKKLQSEKECHPYICDFINFLKEKNMASDSPNSVDFSALEVFYSTWAAKRISENMKNVRENLKKDYLEKGYKWGSDESEFKHGYSPQFEKNMIWSWVVIDDIRYCNISWGINFSADDDAWGWSKDFPDNHLSSPYVFMGFFTKNESVSEQVRSAVGDCGDWNFSQNRDQDLIALHRLGLNECVGDKFEEYFKSQFEIADRLRQQLNQD